MEKFSNEVASKIGFYVYRLIDPRNGRTFYVGKGKNNRIFAHINAVDSYSFYYSNEASDIEKKMIKKKFDNDDGKNIIDKEIYKDPAKIEKIKDIKNEGLQVIHIIQRWGLEEKEAFEIEAAFIDFFDLPNLTNEAKGKDNERGMISVEKLERDLSAKHFIDGPNLPPYIIFKIKDWWIGQSNRYEATRRAWKIDINKAKNYPYALSVTNQIVQEVYKIDSWQNTDSEKKEFVGSVAPDEIRNLFIYKKIPDYYCKKGMASSFLFSKNQLA